ncbi:MAG TPA: membrane bound O-acyl transferase family-domain-containing protein [Verrucomicrobium sp.]|nr:membrane bound O-acyl transferase family-domain-containing protein [Verrucomicrobium sp.]
MTAYTAIFESFPRWGLMWALAGAVFLVGKAAMRSRVTLRQPVPAIHELAWLGLWPGMDAEAFFSRRRRDLKVPRGVILGGVGNAVLGTILLWGVARWMPQPLAAGWVGMTGLVLVLHFGAFRMLASLWQYHGVPVRPIMEFPAAATSLSEFWGRRWNRAFRDLAHAFVYLPVLRHGHARLALGATFLVSGLVHELVITVPAGAGYGLPMVYFGLQALGITLERRLFRRRQVPATLRWAFTHLFTVGPAFILFPPPFVERVMIPFFQFIHALP